MTPIITLTTDFGSTDPYLGIIKGVILSICPKAQIIDISHNIPPHNILAANWILRCSYHYFPKGTIHLCIVDPGVGSIHRKPILLETSNYFFIGPDNGIFTVILEQGIITNAIELTEEKYWLKNISKTFHGREIFAPVASHLACGVSPREFGKPLDPKNITRLPALTLTKKDNGYIGIVQYIDNFGNLITNIPDAYLPQKIHGQIKDNDFHGLTSSYSEGEKDKLFAIIGSHGFLEISVNKGSAAKLAMASVGDEVKVNLN